MTKVLLLTAPGCHWCDEAKALIDRLASEFELTTETRSTEEEEGRTLAFSSGVLFPPAIFVNGQFLQYGRPSERKFRARLAEVAAQPRATRTA
ncbi:MAG: glutaredoxin family protein [Candidatus Limnocylindria bacterium]